MADPKLWELYFLLFDHPEDPRARELYNRFFGRPPEDPEAREVCRRALPFVDDPSTLSPRRQRLWAAYRSLFQQPSESCRSWEPPRVALKDPYILAYKYTQFTEEVTTRRRVYDNHNGSASTEEKSSPRPDAPNPYYKSLLANHDEPPENADDNLSRAIRYAKIHYESFYEVGHVDMIIGILDKQRDLERRSLIENAKRESLARLYHMASLAKTIEKSADRNMKV